ncbi:MULTISPECIES: arginine repressor [Tatumella]|uniref:Arginine repressor n=2 Tax=Tatumella ptyseos TaxID=82987 RepID=A0A085JQ61_9GAMM|nr:MULTISPECIES: ArgR family transcriptional regulator [Tatumella]KFD22607.1 arginine pathway regulatory protein [Tatumella ptyseos ATCC 33301]SQK72103.1 Arginine repressor [Tatumella ptyseos]
MPVLTPASQKELRQLALCQRLIMQNSYLSQEALRRDLKRNGYALISQSTVSRLLKMLGAIKIRNGRGQRIYTLNPLLQLAPRASRTIAEMVIDIVCNNEFILIHTAAGYGRAVARILDCQDLAPVMGVVAGSDNVWIAPRQCRQISALYEEICTLLKVP